MAQGKHYLSENPIPDGYQIYEDRIEVAGLKFRLDAAAAFASRDDGWIELEPDPGNSHDPNAIRVIGCNKGFLGTKRSFIGFVPAQIAATIAASRLLPELRPRLMTTFVGDTGFIEVMFQIIGPKGRIEEYRGLRSGGGRAPDEVEAALLGSVEQTEKERKNRGWPVVPVPYQKLAQYYRKQKRYQDEVSLLERYIGQFKRSRTYGPDPDLAKRLAKARALLDKQTAATVAREQEPKSGQQAD